MLVARASRVHDPRNLPRAGGPAKTFPFNQKAHALPLRPKGLSMRARVYIFVLTLSLCLAALAPFAPFVRRTAAQSSTGKGFRPDRARALSARQHDSGVHTREGAHASRSAGKSSRRLARANSHAQGRRIPARP